MYIEVSSLNKSYGEKGSKVTVLNNANLKIEQGEMCVVLGPSGSGKSTLLNLIGGLDTADSGKIIVEGRNICGLNAKDLAYYRRESLGFVFQFYNLVPNLTVRENIEVCEYLSKNSLNIDELIETLGLTEHQHKFPKQLSGGQQQRTGIARALVKNPKILLCDEPTGALDYKTSKEILVLLEKINKVYNTTMIIITHNNAIADMVHQVVKIRDGKVVKDYKNEKIVPAEVITW